MNDYQISLYNDLMTLVNESEAFYYVDVEKDGLRFRIFNYRLASYTEFLKPGAIECRGSMFQIDDSGNMLRLASMPPEKFWNLNENPATMNLDLSTINLVEDKADGSLISSYLIPTFEDSYLWLKSKGSLVSDQALDATRWLANRRDFHFEVKKLNVLHFTVNMEWVSPDNRIVLPYDEPELRVLNVRNNITGQYVDKDDLPDYCVEIRKRWTKQFDIVESYEDFIKSIPDMQNVEGFVVRLESGQRVKIKTTWYLALHHTKDNINSPRRLFEAVLEEATDDMKSLFHDDKLALDTIAEMEGFVEEKYNHLADVVTRFYERNKELDRKDYAILGQKELDRLQFGAAMGFYTGKNPNFKEILKKNWKNFGLTDGDNSNQDS